MNNLSNRDEPVPDDHFWKEYLKHREYLEKSIIKRMLSDHNVFGLEPEDISHDVLVKYFDSYYNTKVEVRNVPGLLIAIAKSVTLNLIKKIKEERFNILTHEPMSSFFANTSGCGYDKKRVKIEICNLLKEHFPKDACRDYKIIIRKYVRDMTYEQIISCMKLTKNIVQDVLDRKFRKKLLPLLQQKFSDQ